MDKAAPPKRIPNTTEITYGFFGSELVKLLGLEGVSVSKVACDQLTGMWSITTTDDKNFR